MNSTPVTTTTTNNTNTTTSSGSISTTGNANSSMNANAPKKLIMDTFYDSIAVDKSKTNATTSSYGIPNSDSIYQLKSDNVFYFNGLTSQHETNKPGLGNANI